MPKQKRGSRISSQTPEPENQQKDAPDRGLPPSFPISFQDAVLYDVQVKRFPGQADKIMTPGGVSKVEIQTPLRIGERLEVGIKLNILVPNAEEPSFAIDTAINGVFFVAEGTDQELVDAFVQNSAPFLIWPFAREWIQNLTVRMRVLPLLLPTLDLRSIPQPQQKPNPAPDTANAGQEAPMEHSE